MPDPIQMNYSKFELEAPETKQYQETEEKKQSEQELRQTDTYLEQLESSQKNRIFMKGDSQEFKDVKTSMRELYSAMQKTVLEMSLTEFLAVYQRIINSADQYLKTHTGHIYTSVGKQRKRIMSNILDSARREYGRITDTYTRETQTPRPDVLLRWGDIVRETRVERIDLAERETSITGDQTSTVLVIKDTDGSNPTLFFKDEERLLPMIQEQRQACEQLVDSLEKDGKVEATRGMKLLRGLLEYPELHDEVTYLILSANANHIPSEGYVIEREYFTSGLVNSVHRKMPQELPHEQRERIIADAEEVARIAREDLDFIIGLRSYSKTAHAALARSGVVADARIDAGTLLSTRNVATSRMSDILDIAPMIARSQTVVLKDGEKQRRGNAMVGARGKKLEEMSPEVKQALFQSPDYLRQLTILQLFDYICGQVDRHTGNFLIDAQMVGPVGAQTLSYSGITGIDNDIAFGKLTGGLFVDKYGTPQVYLSQLDKIINDDGSLKLPYVDKDMADSILALSPEIIATQFADLLTQEELQALMNRIREVYQGIEILMRDHPERLLTPEQWQDADRQQFMRFKFFSQAYKA